MLCSKHGMMRTMAATKPVAVSLKVFSSDMKVGTLIGCHERVFAAFGSVPRKVLYGTMKTVAIELEVYGDGQLRYLAGFLDFTKYGGFRVKQCQPSRPRHRTTTTSAQSSLQFASSSFQA